MAGFSFEPTSSHNAQSSLPSSCSFDRAGFCRAIRDCMTNHSGYARCLPCPRLRQDSWTYSLRQAQALGATARGSAANAREGRCAIICSQTGQRHIDAAPRRRGSVTDIDSTSTMTKGLIKLRRARRLRYLSVSTGKNDTSIDRDRGEKRKTKISSCAEVVAWTQVGAPSLTPKFLTYTTTRARDTRWSVQVSRELLHAQTNHERMQGRGPFFIPGRSQVQ